LTRYPYPYSLPASVVKLRSALQSAADVTKTLAARYGLYYTFEIRNKRNVLIYKSDEVSDHVRLFKPIYFRALRIAKGFSCRITYVQYNGSPSPLSWSVPFKYTSHRGVFQLVHTKSTIAKLLRNRTPRLRLRNRASRWWFTAPSVRPSPEVVNGTVPYMVISNGVLTTNTVESYQTFGRVWTGSNTPHFGSIKKRNLPMRNHFSRHSRTLDLGLEVSHFDSNSGPPGPFDPDFVITIRSFTSQFGLSYTGTVPSAPSHSALARNKAIKKLVDVMGTGLDANLAQDLVQFRQTAKTISDSVSRIAGGLISLKKGNIPKAIKQLWGSSQPRFDKSRRPKPGGSLANNWLALQYGWKPLLNDIDGTCRSLAEYFQSNDAVRSVRSSATVTDFTRSNLTLPNGTIVGSASQRLTTTCKFVIRYKVDSALKSFLAQTGFTNPVNLAWEVLPFSFVADWFLPIGPYVETLSSFDGLQFMDGCQTQHTRANYLRSLAYSGAPVFPWYYEEYFGGWQRETLLLNRDVLLDFPNSTFPEFKSPFDAHGQHILNGLALIRAVTK